jgi:hypothetical protein
MSSGSWGPIVEEFQIIAIGTRKNLVSQIEVGCLEVSSGDERAKPKIIAGRRKML